jgi:hypothetical protein
MLREKLIQLIPRRHFEVIELEAGGDGAAYQAESFAGDLSSEEVTSGNHG